MKYTLTIIALVLLTGCSSVSKEDRLKIDMYNAMSNTEFTTVEQCESHEAAMVEEGMADLEERKAASAAADKQWREDLDARNAAVKDEMQSAADMILGQ